MNTASTHFSSSSCHVTHRHFATDVAQPALYPVPILFPASSLPVSDGMTDQGNRLSYILINPSPDTRLELHDVVWVHTTKYNWYHCKVNTVWKEKYYRSLFVMAPSAGTWSDQTLSLKYLIRAATGSAVRGSQRATGLICRTAPTCERQKKDKYTVKHCQREERKIKLEAEIQEMEVQRD